MKEAALQPNIVKNMKYSVLCNKGDGNPVLTYSRKDFYKVCLYEGKCIIDYADRSIHLDGMILFFGTPHIPYSWDDIDKKMSYSGLFTEEFLKTNNNSESLQQSPLFKIGGTPIFSLTKEQGKEILEIFEKMTAASQTNYEFREELIRNYINLLIHSALQMQPSEGYNRSKNASSRIASLFLEQMERQFPIESPNLPLKLKNASDFADSLAVHVNHLNKSVKEVTGRSTSSHISDRIITEAKALLSYTDWHVADIAFSLGFEYPTYFNNYFKKHTGITPSIFRGGV
ncbi:response regulator transcription factor [Flavobacterium aquicola]|uniref:AraC-like DNA-binding protein n=1 Tax=Flavobacterium aquicola TaxID=1682742 RepID=A0A3E0EP22_9FLAO|nr:response regulator transcription factor [Flavobacterium aquicola]REG99480.1 AraC-like DNA-binding protein [Flavobacterium aquicola]